MEFRHRTNTSSGHARFSLSNHFGEVIHHGIIPEDGEIVIKDVAPGRYTLWIMDGDMAESLSIQIKEEIID